MACCEGTGVQAAQEDAALPAVGGVSGCSPSVAPPRTEPKGGQHFQGQCSCGEGGIHGNLHGKAYNTDI